MSACSKLYISYNVVIMFMYVVLNSVTGDLDVVFAIKNVRELQLCMQKLPIIIMLEAYKYALSIFPKRAKFISI